jgi:hypothetical protein
MRGTTSVLLGALILAIGSADTAFGATAACAGSNVSFVNGTRNAMLQLQVREESSNKWIDILKDKPLGVLRTLPPLCLPAGRFYEVRAVFQGGSNLDKKKQTLRNNAVYVVTQF